MRRIFLALLCAAATTVALMSGRYFVTVGANAGDASASRTDIKDATSHNEPGDSAKPTESGASPGPSGSLPQSTSASPGPTAPGKPTTTAPGGQGGGGGGGAKPTPTSCASFEGKNAWVGAVGDYGMVYVKIKVCGGAVTTATGSIMESNYEPTNTTALAELDKLAVKYYKTDMSKIAYTGATATAAAYRTSLQSAMSRAGI